MQYAIETQTLGWRNPVNISPLINKRKLPAKKRNSARAMDFFGILTSGFWNLRKKSS